MAVTAIALTLIPLEGAAGDNAQESFDKESALTPHERAVVASIPFSTNPLVNTSGRFLERYSIAQGMKWQDIFKRPTIITLSIGPVPGDPSRESSVGDVHGVFPIEPEYFFKALVDYSSYPRVSPRTVFTTDRSTFSGPFDYHKLVQKVSARFLGFGQTYFFVTNNYEVRLGGDSYGLKWNLEKSLDGKFYSLMGSWYVKGMRCDGTPCSYVRYFNRTGFTEAPAVPLAILRIVTEASFKNLPLQFYNEAVRLRAAANVSRRRASSHGFLTIR